MIRQFPVAQSHVLQICLLCLLVHILENEATKVEFTNAGRRSVDADRRFIKARRRFVNSRKRSVNVGRRSINPVCVFQIISMHLHSYPNMSDDSLIKCDVLLPSLDMHPM